MGMIYALTDMALYFLYPMQDPVSTTTSLASTIHYSWYNQIVLGRKPFSKKSKKIVFLGTSNVLWGFVPEEFSDFVRDYEIINMSAGDANYEILGKFLDLIYEATPQESRKDITFVIGVSFPQFVETKVLSHPTGLERLERELTRYGLYKYKNGTITNKVPYSVIQNCYYFLLPSLFIDKATQQISAHFSFSGAYLYKQNLKKLLKESGSKYAFIKSLKSPSTYGKIFNLNIDRDNVTANQELSLKYWEHYFQNDDGIIHDEQFQELKSLIEKILKNGGSAILVQMPVPKFNKERSKFYHYYNDHFVDIIIGLQDMDDKVLYVDMRDLDNNDDFFDSFHAKPKVTKNWSKRLATEIESFLNDNK